MLFRSDTGRVSLSRAISDGLQAEHDDFQLRPNGAEPDQHLSWMQNKAGSSVKRRERASWLGPSHADYIVALSRIPRRNLDATAILLTRLSSAI